jgi:D-alanine-D-alanine ligase
MSFRNVIVLCGGGASSEREVSLTSGENVYQLCGKTFPSEKVILDSDELPPSVANATDSVIFPETPGEFGEDGGLQSLMEAAGLTFVGSDSKASALCMNKFLTKRTVSEHGITVPSGINFKKSDGTTADEIIASLGEHLFLKPNARGSSIGARVISSKLELERAIDAMDNGMEYAIERKINGIDLTVAVLCGEALEVVEILPKRGFLDYDNKYVYGMSDKICPARIGKDVEKMAKDYSELAFKCCKCRDWARIDFMLCDSGELFFLEINTIPGMTGTSFFPISAAAAGIDQRTLVAKLVDAAAARARRWERALPKTAIEIPT